jgi:hypothetical protein
MYTQASVRMKAKKLPPMQENYLPLGTYWPYDSNSMSCFAGSNLTPLTLLNSLFEFVLVYSRCLETPFHVGGNKIRHLISFDVSELYLTENPSLNNRGIFRLTSNLLTTEPWDSSSVNPWDRWPGLHLIISTRGWYLLPAAPRPPSFATAKTN